MLNVDKTKRFNVPGWVLEYAYDQLDNQIDQDIAHRQEEDDFLEELVQLAEMKGEIIEASRHPIEVT